MNNLSQIVHMNYDPIDDHNILKSSSNSLKFSVIRVHFTLFKLALVHMSKIDIIITVLLISTIYTHYFLLAKSFENKSENINSPIAIGDLELLGIIIAYIYSRVFSHYIMLLNSIKPLYDSKFHSVNLVFILVFMNGITRFLLLFAIMSSIKLVEYSRFRRELDRYFPEQERISEDKNLNFKSDKRYAEIYFLGRIIDSAAKDLSDSEMQRKYLKNILPQLVSAAAMRDHLAASHISLKDGNVFNLIRVQAPTLASFYIYEFNDSVIDQIIKIKSFWISLIGLMLKYFSLFRNILLKIISKLFGSKNRLTSYTSRITNYSKYTTRLNQEFFLNCQSYSTFTSNAKYLAPTLVVHENTAQFSASKLTSEQRGVIKNMLNTLFILNINKKYNSALFSNIFYNIIDTLVAILLLIHYRLISYSVYSLISISLIAVIAIGPEFWKFCKDLPFFNPALDSRPYEKATIVTRYLKLLSKSILSKLNIVYPENIINFIKNQSTEETPLDPNLIKLKMSFNAIYNQLSGAKLIEFDSAVSELWNNKNKIDLIRSSTMIKRPIGYISLITGLYPSSDYYLNRSIETVQLAKTQKHLKNKLTEIESMNELSKDKEFLEIYQNQADQVYLLSRLPEVLNSIPMAERKTNLYNYATIVANCALLHALEL